MGVSNAEEDESSYFSQSMQTSTSHNTIVVSPSSVAKSIIPLSSIRKKKYWNNYLRAIPMKRPTSEPDKN